MQTEVVEKPIKKRGRPASGHAKSNAERQKAYRHRQACKLVAYDEIIKFRYEIEEQYNTIQALRQSLYDCQNALKQQTEHYEKLIQANETEHENLVAELRAQISTLEQRHTV